MLQAPQAESGHAWRLRQSYLCEVRIAQNAGKSLQRRSYSREHKKTKKADVIEKESDEDKDINVEIRETKSSAPIEVVNIEQKASKEKPKKKGWWSK